MTDNWADRLGELATDEDVPGATLAIWADGRQSVAAHGVLNAATGASRCSMAGSGTSPCASG
jgi:hypothetical protein